jgi:putative MATE family efflux protein
VAKGDTRIDMTTGAVTPKLFQLAWPLVLGNLLQTVYNVADLFWVGRVSEEAVAAVSLMFPLTFMFISTGLGISSATIALVSQHIGADEDRSADRVVGQTVLLATVCAIVLAAAGFAARRSILSLMGAEGQVFTEALAYVEVIFLSLPLTFLFFAFRSSLQGAGDTKTAMWLVAVSAGANIVIDPFFVLGWGPFPAWGTFGAAVATLLSRLLATGVGIYILIDGGWGVRLRPRDLLPTARNLRVQRRLLTVGYPAALDGWARSFAAVVMTSFVARFGVAAVAAFGIGVRLMSISWTVAGAIGQATSTGVGQNLGAGTPERAVEVTYKATAATMAILFVAGGIAWLFPAIAMRIFIPDIRPEVIAEGVTFLKIVAFSWSFFGGLMVIQGAFRGAGNTGIAMVLSLTSRWLFRIPAALLLAFGTVTVTLGGWRLGPLTLPAYTIGYTGLGWGVDGLWWAYAGAALASFLLAVGWFLRGTWQTAVVGADNEHERLSSQESPESPREPTRGTSTTTDEDSSVDD